MTQVIDETELSRRSFLRQGGALVVGLAAGGSLFTWAADAGARSDALSAASLRERFEFLRTQKSNQCNLQATALARMPADARLQGSCCSPMVYERYAEQVRGLAKYSHDLVPKDPYDMSVAMARKLTAFNDKILLTAAQQKEYNQAVRQANEGGPCCCACWRWTAFEGQAKALIAYRGWDAKRVAALWDIEDGCGGSGEGGGHGSGSGGTKGGMDHAAGSGH